MGELHELILRDGLEAARLRADSKTQRHAVEAAAQVISRRRKPARITHAGFAMTSLPHKRISDPVLEAARQPNDSSGRVRP